jgi:hypothetical protein
MGLASRTVLSQPEAEYSPMMVVYPRIKLRYTNVNV